MADAQFSINWFEIPTADLERATKFYNTIFQTELAPMQGPDGTIMTFQKDGMPIGALITCAHNAPSETGSLLYFDAQGDMEGVLGRIEAAGGKVILPKTSIGEHGHIAHFMDTENNRVALHSL